MKLKQAASLLPWAHRTPLQQLLLFLLTANISNKSGNLLFAQSYPEQYENVGFVHSWCTVEFHQKSDRVNPSLRLRGMNANFDGFPTRL